MAASEEFLESIHGAKQRSLMVRRTKGERRRRLIREPLEIPRERPVRERLAGS